MAPEIRIDPAITPDQRHAFYRRNQINYILDRRPYVTAH
jgi:hypothetical protein